jgi:hypothetical protein
MIILRKDPVLVLLNGRVVGPMPASQLCLLKDFTADTLISYVGSEKWAPAYRALNLKTDEPPDVLCRGERSYRWTSLPSVFALRSSRTPLAHAPVAYYSGPRRRWADRWFRPVALFNILLGVMAFAAWYYRPDLYKILKVLMIDLNRGAYIAHLGALATHWIK